MEGGTELRAFLPENGGKLGKKAWKPKQGHKEEESEYTES